jgi:hypothetical protein
VHADQFCFQCSLPADNRAGMRGRAAQSREGNWRILQPLGVSLAMRQGEASEAAHQFGKGVMSRALQSAAPRQHRRGEVSSEVEP